MDPETPIDDVQEALAEVTDPARDAAANLTDTLTASIKDLTDATRINSETATGNRDAINRIENNLAALHNMVTDLAGKTGETAVEGAGTVADTAITAPEAATDGIEAVVEAPIAAPKSKRRGMLGGMKKGRRS